MAAGLGFKTFVTGEVLTAADTNGYLMQGVNVFANAAARTAAITSPQEGQMSFLKDTNSTEYYDGAAWVAVGGGGMTVLASGSLPTGSGALNLTSISQDYRNLVLVVRDFYTTTSDDYLKLRFNNSSGTYVYSNIKMTAASTAAFEATTSNAAWMINVAFDNTDKNNAAYIQIFDYTNTVSNKLGAFNTISRSGSDTYNQIEQGTLAWIDTSAITQVNLLTNSTNFSGGTYILYGVK